MIEILLLMVSCNVNIQVYRGFVNSLLLSVLPVRRTFSVVEGEIIEEVPEDGY